MRKMLPVLLLLLVAAAGCSDKKVVTIGRGGFDPVKKKIAEVTETFSQADEFNMTVEGEKPFDVNEYVMRVYKKDGGRDRAIGTETRPLTPTSRGLHRAFPVSELDGSGSYRVEIIMRGKKVGSKDFTVR